MAWLVAYCEARRELYAQERLTEVGVETFCPFELVRRRRRIRGNVHKIVEEKHVLYSRYLFANGEASTVRGARGVLSVVSNSAGPLEVSGAEMAALRGVAAADGLVGVGDYVSNTGELRRRLGLKPGSPMKGASFVIGEASPFTGFIARITSLARLDDTGQLRALVEMFGRQVPIGLALADVGRLATAA